MIGEVYNSEVRFGQAIMFLNKGDPMIEEMDVFYVTQRADQRLRKDSCKEFTPINKKVISPND